MEREHAQSENRRLSWEALAAVGGVLGLHGVKRQPDSLTCVAGPGTSEALGAGRSGEFVSHGDRASGFTRCKELWRRMVVMVVQHEFSILHATQLCTEKWLKVVTFMLH